MECNAVFFGAIGEGAALEEEINRFSKGSFSRVLGVSKETGLDN